ncbi:MAG: PocR ligand-binding domain-containing protein [Vibrio sp.]
MAINHLIESNIIHKIVMNFAQATGLAVVATNANGEEISERFNFSPFCELIRTVPMYNHRCQFSDRCGGLEALRENKPCIYRCHAGLTDFSIPIMLDGHIVGFIQCGQVRVEDDSKIQVIASINDASWDAIPEKYHAYLNVPENPELYEAYLKVPVVNNAKIEAAAQLLKMIVDDCIKKEIKLWITENDKPKAKPAAEEAASSYSVHNEKVYKAIRYIERNFHREITLEEVSHHVSLTPHYFCKLFKKSQGIGFNQFLVQKRMDNAKQLLARSDWSVAMIAENLGFSHPSYFCKVFRKNFNQTPQQYRLSLTA